MNFEFDEAKNQANIKKHNLSLEEAMLVLGDPDRKEAIDSRRDYGEQRIICFGMVPCQSICGRVYVVVYTLRNGNLRIISVRKANEREQNRYYGS